MTFDVSGPAVEVGARAARSRALAVLRVRGRATGVALLPAAVAVVLLAGGATGNFFAGPGWDTARWVVTAFALVVLVVATIFGLIVARARPAVSPTVTIAEASAPDLYRLVRDLADRLEVPAPSAIALTPDCDSWLEDRTHPAHGNSFAGALPNTAADEADGAGGARKTGGPDGPAAGRSAGAGNSGAWAGKAGASRTAARRTPAAPVLVIGSPFLWWMRVAELRAVLAPVVAGTGPSAHPDIAAARRFVRGLDAAVAVAAAPGRGPLVGFALRGAGWAARLLLRECREHVAEMERGVAAAAAQRAQAVDYGLRIVAQEQVGLAYAGWDRLLTRVALPAWRMGRWPSRLDAGVVAALTELSRRDRLAEGFASRLEERPACDLLEEPGSVDEAASLLAARLFHGGPAQAGPGWEPVDWQAYPEEVVSRKWRADAARLHRVLDALGIRQPAGAGHAGAVQLGGAAGGGGGHLDGVADLLGSSLDRIMEHLAVPAAPDASGTPMIAGAPGTSTASTATGRPIHSDHPTEPDHPRPIGTTTSADHPTSPTLPPEPTAPGTSEPTAPTIPADPASLAAQAPSAAPGADAPEAAAPKPATSLADPDQPDTTAPTTPAPPTTHVAPEAPESSGAPDHPDLSDCSDLLDPSDLPDTPAAALAAGLSAELAKEEQARDELAKEWASDTEGGQDSEVPQGQCRPDDALWDDAMLPLFPTQPPRTGRELLTDHVTALVCCAAVDTAGAAPGLDWLDGPALLVDGARAAELVPHVRSLIEDGNPEPLRGWLTRIGVRPEKPVRLV